MRKLFRNLGAQFFDDGAGVKHAIDKGANLGRLNSGQIVADAHIEDGVRKPGCQIRRLRHLDQHGGFDVFLQ